ncbi:DUF6887 family protein [Aphanothece sacrum]|nr:hypothetical protein [Aphanothece sacrum]
MNRKPNFKAMNSQELKRYVLSHREDDEAFHAYVDKINERKDREILSGEYPPPNLHSSAIALAVRPQCGHNIGSSLSS